MYVYACVEYVSLQYYYLDRDKENHPKFRSIELQRTNLQTDEHFRIKSYQVELFLNCKGVLSERG